MAHDYRSWSSKLIRYVSSYNWEAYALASAPGVDEPAQPREEEKRTVTITIRGNVNLIIE